MPIEAKRGCGYRHIGALYLVGSGMALPCDLLPLPITPCPTCHFTIPFTRGFLWIHRDYLAYRSEGHYYSKEGCKCGQTCPICFPTKNIEDNAMLMWVGSRYYTPNEFVKEAQETGVSKRIAEIPKGLKLGETWCLLAHPKVPFQKIYKEGDTVPAGAYWASAYKKDPTLLSAEPEYKPAIFYAFVPRRIEMLIWKSEATAQRLEELKKKGITLITVPDNTKEHA